MRNYSNTSELVYTERRFRKKKEHFISFGTQYVMPSHDQLAFDNIYFSLSLDCLYSCCVCTTDKQNQQMSSEAIGLGECDGPEEGRSTGQRTRKNGGIHAGPCFCQRSRGAAQAPGNGNDNLDGLAMITSGLGSLILVMK